MRFVYWYIVPNTNIPLQLSLEILPRLDIFTLSGVNQRDNIVRSKLDNHPSHWNVEYQKLGCRPTTLYIYISPGRPKIKLKKLYKIKIITIEQLPEQHKHDKQAIL
jgi:hypothetical protein